MSGLPKREARRPGGPEPRSDDDRKRESASEDSGNPTTVRSESSISFVSGADSRMRRRILISVLFQWACRILTYSALAVLAVLLLTVGWGGIGRLGFDFISSTNSSNPLKAGMLAGIWGSFWLILLTALFSVPVGVSAAVYLEEYAADTRLNRLIKVNLSNLAGVPSIVYGILGLTVFVHFFDLFSADDLQSQRELMFTLFGRLRFRLSMPKPLGDVVLAGALTMTLVVLPTIIIASQEAIRAVPSSIRNASLALGATRWQTVWYQVIPAAVPGISTGVILSISRAVGETAPLIMVGALTRASFCPGGIESPIQIVTHPSRIKAAVFDQFTVMPVEIFAWARQPDERFNAVAAAGIIVLLMILLTINGLAMWIRHRTGRNIRW
ncbi:MAG: phosphate ABC transporter permease PstA [Planctomyces sp.]